MDKQIILSISLLSSNRKSTIRKCLDSLKPIMEQISSELIIVDTGSDAETRDILKEYSNHIIPFQWCDDFSAARNAGLKQARGEWFLYIDDDEWFTDVTEIVDFFQSGEYKKYGRALYITRNFQNREGTVYTDDWVSRMIQLTEDTHFEGAIHEYLTPMQGKCKFLKCPASHFGYLFDSAEKMYRHSKRNITLLLKMLEKEKNCIRWWMHLVQEYLGVKEYSNLYDLCRRGIRYFETADIPEINKERGGFYIGCIRADLRRGLYEDTIKDYEEAIRDKRNTELCQAALHINGAAAYMQTKQYGKAAQCCREYLELYDKLAGDDTVMASQGNLLVCDFFGKKDWNSACGILIICELKQGKNQALKQYFESFGWEEDILYFDSDIVPALLDFWGKAEYDDFYVRAAGLLVKRENVSEETVKCLQEKEKVLPEDVFLRLARIFAQADADLPYIIYLRILYQDFCETYSGLSDNLKELFELQEDFLCLPDRLWDIVERSGTDLNGLFCRMEFDRWKAGVDIFMQRSDIDTILKRKKMWFGAEMHDDPDLQAGTEMAAALRYDYFMLRTTEALLIKEYYDHSYEEMYHALLEYVDGNLKLYGAFYNDNAFSGKMEFLPLSCRLAVKLGSVLMQEKDIGYMATLEACKDCLKVYPAMASVIRQYVHLYKEKREAEKKEFTRLKEQLIGKVRELIDRQAYKEAGLILEKLKQLAPEDPDILMLEKMA